VVCDNRKMARYSILGLYVDNLIIAHSAKLKEDGTPVNASSMYARFTTKLAKDWEVEDEGPLKDMLGVEVRRNENGSITLHQRGYVRKVLEKLLPSLPEGKTGLDPRSVLPHSLDLVKKVESVTCDTSIDAKEAKFPDLVKPFQERIGSLMYLSTNTRPDIAYAVNQLCRVMAKPTPELVERRPHARPRAVPQLHARHGEARDEPPGGGLREGSEPLPSGLADCPLRGPRRGRERHRLLQRHPRHRAAERRDGRRLAALAALAVEGDLGRA